MPKKTYNVLSPVDHDNQRIEPGAMIDLEDQAAAPLLTAQVIELAVGQAAAATVPTDPAERQAAIVTAIGQLNPGDAALFTGAGVPKTEAIAAITGWPVSAKERDAAWAQINAQ